MSPEMLLLALATENAELRLQLAEVQDQCIELAVDAGELHAAVETLQARLAVGFGAAFSAAEERAPAAG